MSLAGRINNIRGSLTFQQFAEVLTKKGHLFEDWN